MTTETVMITVRKGDDVLADLLESNGNLPSAMVVRGHEPVVYLWRLSQTVNNNYDTFDSCVVAAVDELSARSIHPRGRSIFSAKRNAWVRKDDDTTDRWADDWATRPGQVTAVCIGATTIEMPGTVVCASFNAG